MARRPRAEGTWRYPRTSQERMGPVVTEDLQTRRGQGGELPRGPGITRETILAARRSGDWQRQDRRKLGRSSP